jgi:ElaB/YqjD/DUF883 family membrane-anchored ribosome-binding protein
MGMSLITKLLNIMTQTTDTDIRDLKTSIDTLAKSVETIAKATEANTKAIADLTLEMRVGFSDLKGEIKTVETKLEGKIDTVNARLTNLETNTKNIMDLAEKLGELKNWKQIAVSIVTAVVGGVIGWFLKGGSNH